MINYFFLEYFRNLSGLTAAQLSEACDKTGESGKRYYSNYLKNRYEFPPEHVKAMADELGIIPEWITQSPVVLTKQDLDSYIEQNEKNGFVPLVRRTDKSNQYIIDSPKAASLLNDFSEKMRSISRTTVSTSAGFGNAKYVEDYSTLIKQSFLPDPDYVPMALRPMIEFADARYDDQASFVRAFASQFPDVISKTNVTALIRKLATAKTIPSITVSNKIIECFATFANVTLDRAFCDFAISSDESVFNLFLATSITLSGWTLYENESNGDMLLTLTNPKFLPNSKANSADQTLSGMPVNFTL